MTRQFRAVLLFLLLIVVIHSSGLQAAEPVSRQVEKLLPISKQLTIPGIGYGQGVCLHEGHVYLYGDAATGVIREYNWSVDEPEELGYTGLEIRLTRNGEDIAPHPTGLTHHPEFGTFLGDTVNQKGTIFTVDWETMKQDRNLDRAVLNMVSDDLAFNGTRPEFVRVNDRWLIATSDYGDENNELRLYDPERLKVAVRSSATGVLVNKQECGPWVQTVEWVPAWNSLALVQNQIAGLRYRLTFTTWNEDYQATYYGPYNLASPVDELEGWAHLGDGWCLYLSSSVKNNVSIGRVELAE
ncbi:hypothetical protein [Rubinisphaera italica]|uniref:Glutamine cyclotransferase n=1 Tax=Rubinisphaera italica TaxID=2527969 RepID=A0A5C5XAY4_9PLAN|nr:hypothetical protein [Rubinisphaera italica]TWT59345.1 hypothetical protein Pan54_00460 [Rubinisphaera italica]